MRKPKLPSVEDLRAQLVQANASTETYRLLWKSASDRADLYFEHWMKCLDWLGWLAALACVGFGLAAIALGAILAT